MCQKVVIAVEKSQAEKRHRQHWGMGAVHSPDTAVRRGVLEK